MRKFNNTPTSLESACTIIQCFILLSIQQVLMVSGTIETIINPFLIEYDTTPSFHSTID